MGVEEVCGVSMEKFVWALGPNQSKGNTNPNATRHTKYTFPLFKHWFNISHVKSYGLNTTQNQKHEGSSPHIRDYPQPSPPKTSLKTCLFNHFQRLNAPLHPHILNLSSCSWIREFRTRTKWRKMAPTSNQFMKSNINNSNYHLRMRENRKNIIETEARTHRI